MPSPAGSRHDEARSLLAPTDDDQSSSARFAGVHSKPFSAPRRITRILEATAKSEKEARPP
jgi:hypothetical protein